MALLGLLVHKGLKVSGVWLAQLVLAEVKVS